MKIPNTPAGNPRHPKIRGRNLILPLNPATEYDILSIEKGEATEAAYPHILYNLHLYDVSRQLVPVVGGYFRLSLKISQTRPTRATMNFPLSRNVLKLLFCHFHAIL